MSADIIQFVPRPNPKADRAFWLGPDALSNDEFMKCYRAECALTGSPALPDKCHSGDPGTITTAEGDVFYIGRADTAPSEYTPPQEDPA